MLKYQGRCREIVTDEDLSSEFDNSSNLDTPQQDVIFETEPVVDEGVQCKFTFKPVCGTDGITYSNACNLKQTSEALGLKIEVLHEGRCTA